VKDFIEKHKDQGQKIEAFQFKFGRNKSYWTSAWLGLRAAIWFAPLTYLRAIRYPLFAIAGGLILFCTSTIGWTLGRFFLLGVGLTGFLIEKPDPKTHIKD
jgi:hypothetical protein